MILWRISNHPSLDGTGGLLTSGRWHYRGRPIVYLTPHPATALLETLVHLEIDAEDLPMRVAVLKVEAPDSVSHEVLSPEGLPENWPEQPAATRQIGTGWLRSRASLLLEVPSVLVPEANNLLLNPLHPEAGLLQIVRHYAWPLDRRLFS